MAIITEKDLQPTYDVIVVGSGAGGGQSAYTLTMNGVKVLMLCLLYTSPSPRD